MTSVNLHYSRETELESLLPCHSEIVWRQKPSQLNKDVIKRSTESTPLRVIEQQDILENEMEKSLVIYCSSFAVKED